ncbi:MAG: shikimate kinase [Oscillospiraceae bacterium]|nr:shikimate kinase [Oscillospiraceae bacterium]
MRKCGLLGEKLGHSYSPAIHGMLADYTYQLYERAPGEVERFVKEGDWDGLNVTIPYKKTVLPFCSELSDRARKIGSVNTLVRREDGSIYGDNTDAYGFEKLLARSGISIPGKKALVLGSGGASVMACAVLEELGAAQVVVISRGGENHYGNLDRHADAHLIVNTTPVGMYPKNGTAAVDLSVFPQCEGVIDVVYNPARTALLLQAERLAIPCAGGLYMLVAQAKRSAELFTGQPIPDSEIDRIERSLRLSMENIVLIGMPGSGKSSVAALLGQRLGRVVLEADEEVIKMAGCPIPEIFAREGEEGFRARENLVLQKLGKLSGAILSTGGGCVTREENYDLLHQNGRIFCLQRDTARLPKEGRPISQKSDLEELYRKRRPFYERFADVMVDNNGTLEETVEKILEDIT